MYVTEEFGAGKEDVAFCSDSGSNIPKTAGFRGVLAWNTDDQLAENVKQTLNGSYGLKVYLLRGDFRGLQGCYRSGVIEGAYHQFFS